MEKTTDTDSHAPRRNDAAQIWERVRGDLRASTPPSVFDLWLEPLEPVEVDGAVLLLSAPDHVRTWVQRRYSAQLKAALARHSEFNEIGFASPAEPVAATRNTPLPDSYTFDRFVIGAGNRVAHAAALAVAELPGEAYNPLFIYGVPGLGKTHLMGAIAQYVRANHPLISVRYTNAERFTGEFIAALRSNGADAFKRSYRDVRTLLIDDVQFLEGKQHTEEEFFHTFNVLYEAGHQIVLSSDRPPSALEKLTERLRNRFEWGLSVEVSAPDVATRVLLIGRLIDEHQLPIDDPLTVRTIAELAQGNIRRLEGALTRVAALSSVLGEPATPLLARQALAGTSPAGSSTDATELGVEEIQDAVCQVLHLSPGDLTSTRRTPDVVRGRHIAIYLTRELTELTLAEIGRQFNRDHSTVLHALRSVSRKLEPGSEVALAIDQIRSKLSTMAAGAGLVGEDIHKNAQNPQSVSTPLRP